MPPTNLFDVTFPPDTQQANQLGVDIRTLKLDLQQRMGLISGLAASIWNPGADAQPANWTGLLYFATDTGKIFQWSGSAWVDVTADFITVPGSQNQNIFDVTQVPVAAPGVATQLNTITIPAASMRVGSRVDLLSGFSYTGGAPTLQLVTASGTVTFGSGAGSFGNGVAKASLLVVDATHAALLLEFGQAANFQQSGQATHGFIIANALTLATQVTPFAGTITPFGLSAVVTY